MQRAYASAVKSPSRRKLLRQANLETLISEAGGVTALAATVGTEKSYLSAITAGRRGVGDELAARLERCMGKSTGWMDQQHRSEGHQASEPSVARYMSHPLQSDELLQITWETLVTAVPSSLFVLVLRDDALAPEFPRGTAVVWSKARKPQPGRLVLVRDQYGRDHVRAYHLGRAPGQWTAAAHNPAFPSFDPLEDGLEILAVHRGVLDGEDD
jgi:plasmid maintenance system antidote protein VapI